MVNDHGDMSDLDGQCSFLNSFHQLNPLVCFHDFPFSGTSRTLHGTHGIFLRLWRQDGCNLLAPVEYMTEPFGSKTFNRWAAVEIGRRCPLEFRYPDIQMFVICPFAFEEMRLSDTGGWGLKRIISPLSYRPQHLWTILAILVHGTCAVVKHVALLHYFGDCHR